MPWDVFKFTRVFHTWIENTAFILTLMKIVVTNLARTSVFSIHISLEVTLASILRFSISCGKPEVWIKWKFGAFRLSIELASSLNLQSKKGCREWHFLQQWSIVNNKWLPGIMWKIVGAILTQWSPLYLQFAQQNADGNLLYQIIISLLN